jgi:hypothetical protein
MYPRVKAHQLRMAALSLWPDRLRQVVPGEPTAGRLPFATMGEGTGLIGIG